MKKQKNIAIAFLIIFLLMGAWKCKKEKNTYTSAEGTVIDKTTNSPIANATVYLQALNTECYTCPYSMKKTVSADANGKFSLSFNAEKGYSYYLSATANRYFENNPNDVYLESGEQNNKNTPLQPEAFLKVYIKDSPP